MFRTCFTIAVVAIALTGCSSSIPIPFVRTEGLPPQAREQIQSAMKAAQAEPGSAASVARYGRFLLAYRFDESALQCFRLAAKLDSASYRWPYYIGVLEQRRAGHRAAADAFEQALSLNPADPPSLLRLADSFAALGELEPARENYLRLLQIQPSSARASYGLGAVYARMGNTAKAIEHLGKACGSYSRYGKARRLLATVYEKAGEHARAQEQIDLGRATPDREPPLVDPLLSQATDLEVSARRHTTAGIDLLENGLPKAALREFQTALEIDRRSLGAHLYSIAAYQQSADLDTAKKHFDQAVAISPDEPRSYLFLGRALLAAARYAEAESVLAQLTKVDPASPEAWALLGDCAWHTSQRDRADQHYREAFRLDPESPLANNGMGLIAHSRGDHSAAIPFLTKAQALPGAAALPALEALASSFQALGDQQGAIRALRQARAVINIHGPADARPRIDNRLRSLE